GPLRGQPRPDRAPPVAAHTPRHAELTDAGGKPVDGAQIGFGSLMPAMGSMPEMKGGGDVTASGNGKYQVGYTLPMLGDWSLTLRIDAPGHAHAELGLRVSPPRKGYVIETRGVTATHENAPQNLELSPERQQLIGVVYAKVERRPLRLQLRASGRVEIDETRISDVVLKYDAYVEQLFVNQIGQPSKKGQPLLTLYSPELLS